MSRLCYKQTPHTHSGQHWLTGRLRWGAPYGSSTGASQRDFRLWAAGLVPSLSPVILLCFIIIQIFFGKMLASLGQRGRNNTYAFEGFKNSNLQFNLAHVLMKELGSSVGVDALCVRFIAGCAVGWEQARYSGIWTRFRIWNWLWVCICSQSILTELYQLRWWRTIRVPSVLVLGWLAAATIFHPILSFFNSHLKHLL